MASTDFEEEVEVVDSVGYVRISFVYSIEEVTYVAGIAFAGVLAYRRLAERFCGQWETSGVYDTLVEVIGSKWLQELGRQAPSGPHVVDGLKHYMIYLDSGGCHECVATEWYLVAPERVR